MTSPLPATLDAVTLIVLAAASYRITRLVVLDTVFGYYPGDCPGEPECEGTFLRRLLDKALYDDNGAALGAVRGWLGSLLSCVWCSGLWVSLGVVWLWDQGPAWTHWGLVVAAVAGAQGFIGSRLNA